jgi:hypothetical protein
MGTSKDDIRIWFKEGTFRGATHLIVVCDTYDWEDYPVYAMPEQDAREEASKYDGHNMQKIMEVYNLSQDMEKQIDGGRCQMNYD